MRLIEKVERIVELDDRMFSDRIERDRLAMAVEDETGIPYDEFLEGMRRLMAPV